MQFPGQLAPTVAVSVHVHDGEILQVVALAEVFHEGHAKAVARHLLVRQGARAGSAVVHGSHGIDILFQRGYLNLLCEGGAADTLGSQRLFTIHNAIDIIGQRAHVSAVDALCGSRPREVHLAVARHAQHHIGGCLGCIGAYPLGERGGLSFAHLVGQLHDEGDVATLFQGEGQRHCSASLHGPLHGLFYAVLNTVGQRVGKLARQLLMIEGFCGRGEREGTAQRVVFKIGCQVRCFRRRAGSSGFTNNYHVAEIVISVWECTHLGLL